MRKAGLNTSFILLRSPQLSRIEEVIADVDISLNSELLVIAQLSRVAVRQQKTHKIILMVELGDLREGILLTDLDTAFEFCLALPNIEIVGIGTNLSCLSGVQTDDRNMLLLSSATHALERKYAISLAIISGGNSATINWIFADRRYRSPINNLRTGEALLLGCESLFRQPIKGLHQHALTLVAEVIEAKIKPSVPEGKIGENAFGNIAEFNQRGEIQRSIVNIGQQDVLDSNLKACNNNFQIIASSSDHLVLDSSADPLEVGDLVKFNLNYGSLLTLMTSPYVRKHFVS